MLRVREELIGGVDFFPAHLLLVPSLDHPLDLAFLVLGEEPPDVLHLLFVLALIDNIDADLTIQVPVGCHGLPSDGLVSLAYLVELVVGIMRKNYEAVSIHCAGS